MARKDKVLDILALSSLPEDAKIATLAHKWLGKSFPREQAKAIIDCYFDANGRLSELTQKLLNEKSRQEKIRNDRAAVSAAAKMAAASAMDKYRGVRGHEQKRKRAMEIALATFGPHVRENFNADALSLMSLISGEDRWYEVRWLDAGFRPVRCALIEIVTMTPRNGPLHTRFLIYRTNGRVLVARTLARELQAAWAGQLPEDVVVTAASLKADGFSFKTDLEGQELVVLRSDGTEFRRVPWSGKTVDE